MPLNDNLRTYLHIKAILDAAIEAGGGRYQLVDAKQAIRWRLDAYQFRKLFVRMKQKELKTDRVETIYDNMLLRIDGNTVIIDKKEFSGFLTTHDGTVITPPDPYAVQDAALDEEADELAKSLNFTIDLTKELDLE